MTARDGVKTMVPRARSTLDGHPEVKQRRATQIFLLLSNSKSQATSFAAYDWITRPSKNFSHTTQTALHISLSVQWLQVTVSLRMEPSDFTSILAR